MLKDGAGAGRVAVAVAVPVGLLRLVEFEIYREVNLSMGAVAVLAATKVEADFASHGDLDAQRCIFVEGERGWKGEEDVKKREEGFLIKKWRKRRVFKWKQKSFSGGEEVVINYE